MLFPAKKNTRDDAHHRKSVITAHRNLHLLGVSRIARQNDRRTYSRKHTHRLLGAHNVRTFAWILGLGLALAFGIINVMWLESTHPYEGEERRNLR